MARKNLSLDDLELDKFDVDSRGTIARVETELQPSIDDVNTTLIQIRDNADDVETRLGSLTESSPISDTASSGLNGRLQRIAQRLTSLIAFFASGFGAIGGAIRAASQLGDGAGNAITSHLDSASSRGIDVYPVTGFNTASNTRPTVTAVSATILAANTGRRYAIISNQSGATIFIKFGAAAVANEGIRIINNDLFQINNTNLWTGTINAIRSVGSGAIEVFEGT